MENNNVSRRKRIIRKIVRWFFNVLIITTCVYVFEWLIQKLHWNTWESFSGKMELADNSILSFAKQVSPMGLYVAYKTNRTNNHYGIYFYKFSAPFNITRACIGMQKRVFFPDNPTTEQKGRYLAEEFELGKSRDSEINDKVPLSYIQNKSWRPEYIRDTNLYLREPEYLQNACSLNIENPDVIKKSFERSGWEWILAIPDSIMTWMKLNWNHEDGSSNWPCRIFLVWTLLFASFSSTTGTEKKAPGFGKKIFGFVGRFLLSMLFFGLLALLIWFVIWAVLETGSGINVASHAFSGFVAGITTFGGFIRLFFTEASEHLGFEGKQKVAERVRVGFLRGLLKKRK